MDKYLLSNLLSTALQDTTMRIDASFVWEAPARVMRLTVTDEKTVRVRINLNGGETAFFGGGKKGMRMGTFFRAQYMAQYIRCLETARQTVPQTLFDGLVTVDALADVCFHRETIAVSPLAKRAKRGLHPIHMYCAQVALEQMTATCGDDFKDVKAAFAAYMALPETAYDKKGHAVFASVRAADIIKQLKTEHCGLCAQTDTVFWSDLSFRIWLFCDGGTAWQYGVTDGFAAGHKRFLKASGEYLQTVHHTLTDNQRAVLEMVEKAKRLPC